MSRIGSRILTIPEKVNVVIENNIVKVNGPKGELSLPLTNDVVVKVEDKNIMVEKKNDSDRSNAMQGTVNSLILNMIEGVVNGYSKTLEMVGVGYRFQLQGNTLVISVGFSHLVKMPVPNGLQVEVLSNTEIVIKGISKELVGEFAAVVRKIKKPEPYKGKGIRYKDEHIRRKEGKKAAK